MLIITLKRIFRSGLNNFWRNSFVSLSSVLIMVVTLFVICSVIFVSAILNASLAEVKDRVDVNVYFVTSADEGDIQSVQKALSALPEVKSVTYTSREQALLNFKDRNKDNELALAALDELNGQNPLGASLNIKAKDPSQYENIAKFLNGDGLLSKDGSSIIDVVNYNKNKEAIDSLSRIISSVDKIGTALTVILIIISILITFNTIRLAIYISREEISVMRLVGASNKYVRGPFVITGALYGLVSAVITLAIFYPLTYWLGRQTSNFGINIFGYYLSHFGEIALIIACSGVGIATVSSWFAVRRYLKQ